MYRIISAISEIVSPAVILILIVIGLHRTCRGLRNHSTPLRLLLSCLFCVYLAALWSLAGLPDCRSLQWDGSIQPMPFRDLAADIKNTLLNVLLFVPLGLLLPLLWSDHRSIGRVLLSGLALSAFIEVMQLFTFRTSDINDVLTNTLGALLGFLPTVPLLHHFPSHKSFRTDGGRCERLLLFCLSFSVMFFFAPLLPVL